MSTIHTVFFDVGATLLTPSANEGITFSLIARELGITIDSDEVISKVPQMYALYEQLYEQDDSFWSDDIRAKAIWIEMYEYMASLLSIPPQQRRKLAEAIYLHYFSPGAWRPYDDVLPALQFLHERGYRMGLISNWDSSLSPIIDGLGMSHFFETVIASAEVRLHKPMPEIFKLALKRLDISGEEAMHIGDHLFADVEGSAKAGITPVLLDRRNKHGSYQGRRIASLSQIKDILAE